jgi:hypothetical protein
MVALVTISSVERVQADGCQLDEKAEILDMNLLSVCFALDSAVRS